MVSPVAGASIRCRALDPHPLPTIVLPHGQAQATFRIMLAKPLAIDTHLERDVAIATTREL